MSRAQRALSARARHGVLVVVAGAATTGFALAAAGAPEARAATGPRPPHAVAVANIARIVALTPARARLHGAATQTIDPIAPLSRGQTQLRIVARRMSGGRWFVRVLVPQRPNGRSAWVAADRVRLLRTRLHVYVDRRARRLTVTRGDRTIRSARVVVGAPRSPTPAGEFAISERLRQSSARGFVGPWVLPLTAFSGTYRQFDGGPGRVAIHGRGGASLRDPLGTARSHGCIRVANGLVRWMARSLPPGVPVTIR
ncbi:MAG TPA: L,D-transpeptidase [Baekduia sp.]|nr:L,D-transpeptidase [Baekduia sp.]